MSHNREAQQWVLLGTSSASKQIWGLREINFPCGYMMPPGAYSEEGQPLERPGPDSVWAMGGYALELSRGGKDIPSSHAEVCIAGYRPWVCVFHTALLDELVQREHTIKMWDRGIAIFHGLWRQSSQYLGDLIPVDKMVSIEETKTELEITGTIRYGDPFSSYIHKATDIISFMSQFMTISPGDIWVLGPLVAQKLSKGDDAFIFRTGVSEVKAKVGKWPGF